MQVAVCGPNLRDQSKGQFHVHAAGCGDLKHYGQRGNKYGGEEPWVMEAENSGDVVVWVYEDQINEQPENEREEYINNLFGDFHFAPCVKDLS